MARDAGSRNRLTAGQLVDEVRTKGRDAQPELSAALRTRSSELKDYAVAGLALIGDDTEWEAVFDRLKYRLTKAKRHPHLLHSSDVEAAVAYLGQHLDGASDRQRRLVDLLRAKWDRLFQAEQEWLAIHWPGLAPGSNDVAGRPNCRGLLEPLETVFYSK